MTILMFLDVSRASNVLQFLEPHFHPATVYKNPRRAQDFLGHKSGGVFAWIVACDSVSPKAGKGSRSPRPPSYRAAARLVRQWEQEHLFEIIGSGTQVRQLNSGIRGDRQLCPRRRLSQINVPFWNLSLVHLSHTTLSGTNLSPSLRRHC